MYARRTRTKASPDQVDAVRQAIESRTAPLASGLPGYRGGYWLIDRETGEGDTFGFYDSQENLDASRAGAAELRDSAVQSVGGQVLGVDEFEVTADTGQKVHRTATHARVTELEGDPARWDDALRVVRDAVIPAVQNFAGFVGGFWLGQRETGRGVAVTLFDSAGSIAASRDTAGAIRSRAAAEAGSTIGSIREYEILARVEAPAGAGAG